MRTQDDIARDWRQRSFGCSLWTDAPGQRWENFQHPVDELVMVLEGAVEFEVSGAVTRPHPGEELLIPARALHSVRNVGATTAHWLYGYRDA